MAGSRMADDSDAAWGVAEQLSGVNGGLRTGSGKGAVRRACGSGANRDLEGFHIRASGQFAVGADRGNVARRELDASVGDSVEERHRAGVRDVGQREGVAI